MNPKPILFVLFVVISLLANAQEISGTDTLKKQVFITHTSKGFEFKTPDNKFLLQIASRFQFRFATPGDQDPVTFNDFTIHRRNILKVNRARLKIGGHAYQPWLKYNFEYELAQNNLLDFKIMIEKWKGLSFKVGQWKTDYNRERVISSGEQQMVERSLINRPFTLDRQQGVSVYGHLSGKGVANIHYWLSVLTGLGRGARSNDDYQMMYVGRLQWNPLGRVVDMSGSDLERTAKPALLIAIASAANRSPYTRFSQAGGGQLEGYADGKAGQYKTLQGVVETAYKFKGFSWQHESHVKQIDDRVNQNITQLGGSYVQAGYFLHEVIPKIPTQLETAFRYAVYRPDLKKRNNLQQEYSFDLNYFFNGHKNKLTAEYSFIVFDQPTVNYANGSRVRLQWDISF